MIIGLQDYGITGLQDYRMNGLLDLHLTSYILHHTSYIHLIPSTKLGHYYGLKD